MATTNRNGNPLETLKGLLKVLFQLDATGLESGIYHMLDFGIYRIMNYRRQELERFMEQDLSRAVEKEFTRYKTHSEKELVAKIQEKRKEIEKLEKELGEPILKNGEIEEKLQDKPFAREYSGLKKQLEEIEITESTQTQVFNDLFNFFSRYYEDGDFISKRRHSSQQHKYAIPYDGEEVKLYWANFDQYYVKTTEVFKDYECELKGWRITFRTVLAPVKAGNITGERRYFVLCSEDPVKVDKEQQSCLVQFQYGPLTVEDLQQYSIKTKAGEEKKTGISQEELNTILAERIGGQIKEIALRSALAEKQEERTILEKHLYKYTRKITSDFFIHKNLKSFLERELDYFIKAEVIDLNNLEPRHITRAKVVQGIGKRIIEFLSQIEDFQKRLWEKKKFVLRTDYVLTLDRIPEEFHQEIWANEEQLKEWEGLGFAVSSWLSSGTKSPSHLKLPVDTKHFDSDFKERLLEKLSQQGNLDDLIDGILLKSENWQALNLLTEKYREKVKCIYIDPPYNTGSDEFIYKDNYQHSSWLSMMYDRLELAKEAMRKDGVIFIHIDENEQFHLRELLEVVFGPANYLAPLIWMSRAGKGGTATKIQIGHEHVESATADIRVVKLKSIEKVVEGGSYQDEKGRYKRELLRQWGGQHDRREDRPTLHFGIPTPWGTEVYPKRPDGTAGRWRFSKEKVTEMLQSGDIDFVKDEATGEITVYRKIREGQKAVSVPGNILDDVGTSADGTKNIQSLFGTKVCPTCKPTKLGEKLIELVSWHSEEVSLTVDFFAGSGTTAHAVINLNRQDGGRRKYILVEIGDWFDTVLLPRLKKVVFCDKWKEGKPAGGQGVSHMFKYHYLEQYEDTLHNIEFPQEEKGQKVLKLFGSGEQGNEYLVKYFLQYETEGSPSLLNLKQFANPFEYKLKVISSGKGEEIINVDLVETFNYLLGLKVNQYKFRQENGRKYVIVLGEKGNRPVAVVWRPTTGIDLGKDKEVIEKAISHYNPEEVFINGDAFYPRGYRVIESEFKALMGV